MLSKVEEIEFKEIKRVIDAINESVGVDFSNYAFSSFRRRIMRFLEVNKIRNLDEFISIIKSDKTYTRNLIKDITVNVTEMYRDPSFWMVLRDVVLPKICFKPAIKIWHAGCSTGEEVYSMAILLKESNLLNKTEIVATDLTGYVLDVAKNGVYNLKSQETNSKNYEQFGGKGKLSDYYAVIGNCVHFNQQLIENVNFRQHNLAQDGPFSDFDLILCRNVLIYFNFDLQEKVIGTFDNSMKVGSFLGIGSKESVQWCKAARLFEAENQEEKIYRKAIEKTQSSYQQLKLSNHP